MDWRWVKDKLLGDPRGGGGLSMAASASGLGSAVGGSAFKNLEKSFTSDKTYARKVFLGGLPPDVDADEIKATFQMFGPILVDWPGKASTAYLFPPKGFAFIFFSNESSVHHLVDACWQTEGKLYYPVSSSSMKNKLTEVRPWKIADSIAIADQYFFGKQQHAAFVGGIPRRVTAVEIARCISAVFGGVGYVAIFLENHTDYPKGSGVVLFSNYQSYAAAVLQKYVCMTFSSETSKIIEFKPFEKSPNESSWDVYRKLAYLKRKMHLDNRCWESHH